VHKDTQHYIEALVESDEYSSFIFSNHGEEMK